LDKSSSGLITLWVLQPNSTVNLNFHSYIIDSSLKLHVPLSESCILIQAASIILSDLVIQNQLSYEHHVVDMVLKCVGSHIHVQTLDNSGIATLLVHTVTHALDQVIYDFLFDFEFMFQYGPEQSQWSMSTIPIINSLQFFIEFLNDPELVKATCVPEVRLRQPE